VQQATSTVFAAEYNSFNLHSFNTSARAFGRRRVVAPKSEFYVSPLCPHTSTAARW